MIVNDDDGQTSGDLFLAIIASQDPDGRRGYHLLDVEGAAQPRLKGSPWHPVRPAQCKSVAGGVNMADEDDSSTIGPTCSTPIRPIATNRRRHT